MTDKCLLEILMFVLFVKIVYAQPAVPCADDSLRLFFFSTIHSDGTAALSNSASLEEWIHGIERHYDYFEVTCTDSFSLTLPSRSCAFFDRSYSIRLYKLTYLVDYDRYLLYYEDFCNTQWLRLRGYVETDVHLLFKHFQEEGCLKKDLKNLMEEWSTLDELFAEVDLPCLLRGYLKKETSYDCFVSEYYRLSDALCINCNLLGEDEKYSSFSRMSLEGLPMENCVRLFSPFPCSFRDWFCKHGLLPE